MSKPEEVSLAIERKYGDGNWSFELRQAICDAILAAKAEEVEAVQKLIAERMSGEINLIAIAKDADDAESHLLHSLLLREQQEIAIAIRKRGEG